MTAAEKEAQRNSRVILALGSEAIARMAKYKVGIIGLSPTGSEIIKNLILTGVGTIEVSDSSKNVTNFDVGSNFFARPCDLEQTPKLRVDTILRRLHHLNRTCNLTSTAEPVTDSWLSKFNSVILAEILPFSEITRISKFCHDQKIQFIFAATVGPNATLFEDFTDNFVCQNPGGQPPREAYINQITKAVQPLVCLADFDKDVIFSVGNTVTFSGFDEMPQINGLTGKIVKKGLNSSYRIDINTKEFNRFNPKAPYGKMTQIIPKRTIKHKIITETLNNTLSNQNDYDTLGVPVRDMIVSISKFWDENGRPPNLFDKSDAANVIKTVKNDNPDILLKSAMLYSVEYPPTVGMIGGCAAQECLKYCTEVFLPTDSQWFSINRTDVILWSADGELPSLSGTRYDPIIATTGNKVFERIQNLSALIVGVGAIGCEYARYAAIFGIKNLTLIDNDRVELSNLTRQFLFRDKHQGMPKAVVGRLAILKNNKDLLPENITAFEDKFVPQTAKKVGRHFDIVFSAVDTVHGRNFISDYTAVRGIPMVNAGIEKHRGNFNIYIPGKTGKAAFKEMASENLIPCTLKNMPTTPNHLMQWAHNEFAKFFKTQPSAAIVVIQKQKEANSNNSRVKVDVSVLKTGVNFLCNAPKDFVGCVQWALNKFTRVIEHRPVMQLKNHPNEKFKSVPFDVSRPNHREYILAAARLKAYVHGIKVTENDIQSIEEIVTKRCTKPKSPVDAEINIDKGLVDRFKLEEDLKNLFDSNNNSESEAKTGQSLKCAVIEFDKDKKLDIEYIEGYSKSRAEVLSIPMEHLTQLDIMKIVGSIAPTLATTTSVAGAGPFSGLPMLYTEPSNSPTPAPTQPLGTTNSTAPKRKVDKFDGNLIFTGLDLRFCGQIPPPRNKKLGMTDQKFSTWDFIDVDDNPTVRELKERIEKKYGVDAEWTVGDIIFSSSSNPSKHVVDALKDVLGYDEDYYMISQSGYIHGTCDEALLPPIRVIIK